MPSIGTMHSFDATNEACSKILALCDRVFAMDQLFFGLHGVVRRQQFLPTGRSLVTTFRRRGVLGEFDKKLTEGGKIGQYYGYVFPPLLSVSDLSRKEWTNLPTAISIKSHM